MPKPKPNQRVVMYSRYSPRPNAGGSTVDGENHASIEAQEREMERFCAEKNPEWMIVKRFRDPGMSGSEPDRPGLWQAVQACQTDFVLLVRWHSRLARDVYLSEVIRKAVEKKGARIVSAEEGEEVTPQDRLIRQILQAMAEYERKMIGIRTKYALLAKQKNGQRVSSRAPYGCDFDPNDRSRMILNDEEQQVLIEMRDMREEQGMSYERIAQELDSMGVPTKYGIAWDRKTVQRILNRIGAARDTF